MDRIPIEMRADGPWGPLEVPRALARERELRREANDMTRPVAEQIAADRRARQLAAGIQRHCVNAAAVRADWLDLVEYPRRSLSGAESFNRCLRVPSIRSEALGGGMRKSHGFERLHANMAGMRQDASRSKGARLRG